MPRKSSVGEQVGVSDLRVERCHPRSLRVFGESHSSIARLARVTGISAAASSAPAGASPCTHQTRTTVPRAPQDESTHNLIGPSRVDERNTVHHDAWRNGALGEMGLRIVDRLYRHPGKQTQTEVAQALGTTVGTINCHVGPSRPLAAYGLIDRAARGAIAVTRWPDIGLLDQIAVDLGTHGRYEALLDQIRQDYRDRGLLDADGYWLDPATGERKDKASWL